MHNRIIISLFLIGLLITSTILPFTTTSNFSRRAMAQEMGYYDDDYEDKGYVDSSSDINYNHENKRYSNNQDEDNKYECRTGPFEGFFVSSPEFCFVKKPSHPPSRPVQPTETLNVVKNTECQADPSICKQNPIQPSNFTIQVQEGQTASQTTKSFSGSSTGTNVTLHAGPYNVTEQGLDLVTPNVCSALGYDAGRNASLSTSIPDANFLICTHFTDECQGNITPGTNPGTCTINNVLVQQHIVGNNVYIVWSDGNEIFFAVSTDGGQTFSAPKNISNNAGNSTVPQIAVSGGNNVYIIWEDNTPGNNDIFFAFSINAGQTFSTPKNISNSIEDSFDANITVIGNTVYVVWKDNILGNDANFFTISTNGGQTFSTPSIVSSINADTDCSPIPIKTDIGYTTHNNIGLNFRIFYPDDFNPPTEIPPTEISNGGVLFEHNIPSASIPDICPFDTDHTLQVHIFQLDDTDPPRSPDEIKNLILNELVDEMYGVDASYTDYHNLLDSQWTPSQFKDSPYTGESIDYEVNVDNDPNADRQFKTFFITVDNHTYILAYSVDQENHFSPSPNPDNFNYYFTQRVEKMVDSFCVPINAYEIPCNEEPIPSSKAPYTVTEEWINTNYKQNPNFGILYKVIVTCVDPSIGSSCIESPKKITKIDVFAGSECITKPSTCNFNTADKFYIQEGTLGHLIWSAFRTIGFPTWNLYTYTNEQTSGTFKVDFVYYLDGISLGQSAVLSLTKTTTCDKDKVCQEEQGPASPPSGTFSIPYYPVVGPEVDTGIMVEQGDLVRIFATGLVDFGGAFLGIGAPILGPDGDNENIQTPSDYPAPTLRKNSLIVKIGEKGVRGTWHQGGSDQSFIAEKSGKIILGVNDAYVSDNSRGWTVTLLVKSN
jgi:hypothetical protein